MSDPSPAIVAAYLQQPGFRTNPNGRRPAAERAGSVRLRAWFDSWVNVHVMIFMFLFNAMNAFNDRVFSVFISLALMNTRRNETLLQAVARGDARKVEKLAKKKGSSALPVATVGRIVVGPELDAEGRTALHLALERLEEVVSEEEDAVEDARALEAPTNIAMARQASFTMTRDMDTEAAQGTSSAEWLVIVRCLIDSRIVDPNTRDAHERTPLHIAVRAGLHEVARGLIGAGADPTLLCKGRSTLHQAAVQRDTKMLVLLLDAAAAAAAGAAAALAYINCTARDGWSALGLGARAGNAAIVKALLDAGADRGAVMQNGKTALDIARLNKTAAVVALLE